MLCLSGRCDKAWENELQLNSLWPHFCLLIFGMDSDADLCKRNYWTLVVLHSAFAQWIGLSGSMPYSPLDNLPVPLVTEITSRLIFLYSPFPREKFSELATTMTQLSLFTWRPLKVYKRKGTDQTELDAKSP